MLNNLPEYRISNLRSNIQGDYLRWDNLIAAFEILSTLVDQVIEKYFIVIEGLLFKRHLVLLLSLHLVVYFLGFLVDFLDLIVLELGGLLDQTEEGLVVDLATTVHFVDLAYWIFIGVWEIVLEAFIRLFLKDDDLVLLQVLDGSIKEKELTPFQSFVKALSHHFAG